jgi:hypothetical protein
VGVHSADQLYVVTGCHKVELRGRVAADKRRREMLSMRHSMEEGMDEVL